ncbi:uncharacterized protein DS421_20g704470 [Arachis hypogaea]|nr:uncharacterized protein DS421_20g704470 [Arachis hypogaea]
MKYSQEDEQPEVTTISDDSNQSTDVEEVVSPNTADLVEMNNHMRDMIFHTYSKELQPSDMRANRLAKLHNTNISLSLYVNGLRRNIEDLRRWRHLDYNRSPLPWGNTFLFQAHQSPTNPFDIKFGLG